ncbi:phage tail protein [Roseivirga seohaensis subsp. aquiponti]|uniref:Phage tail protein n=1 Tax=Roseivirga seohaensis subsp. aquiponti TaxID=1566026 RepID=A0A0L8AJ52_9BACT|nr:phage tail sheath C-terminal domain-containing protein [Roseivirga seohaensis]KOF02266.1 phage tail protein [Roseivirga seohaensis subsp. aquiponti]
MTDPRSRKTPGVYINEANAFPNSVVQVPTAVPAFIGYTPKAEFQGKNYLNKPVKVNSFFEFAQYFMLPNAAQQYRPQYYITEQSAAPANGDYLTLGNKVYTLNPDPNTIYYLYNSVRLFYQNGGGTAYIVSVGGYGSPSGAAMVQGENIFNPNVKLSELKAGLQTLIKETEPTMYVVPEATLLSKDDNASLMQAMLGQSEEMQTAVSILDVLGGHSPDPVLYTQGIDDFREGVGNIGLSYGAAYYPFLTTTITQASELDYTNFNGGNTDALFALLQKLEGANPALEEAIALIKNASTDANIGDMNQALMIASKVYNQLFNSLLSEVNVLPPSGAMAGIYTVVDNNEGVWVAPANVSINAVIKPTLDINNRMQEDLNVPLDGKAVNALRSFTGMGVLVWGARTLDGNSNDWRYINVRRTMIMIEQSIKAATMAYVFEPNDANTWVSVQSMISSFLNSVWKQGGLVGAKPADAFSVSVGLGSTMTGEDILNGIMRVSVQVAVTHPAEFILITFEQQMQKG